MNDFEVHDCCRQALAAIAKGKVGAKVSTNKAPLFIQTFYKLRKQFVEYQKLTASQRGETEVWVYGTRKGNNADTSGGQRNSPEALPENRVADDSENDHR